jgi:arylsulfatase
MFTGRYPSEVGASVRSEVLDCPQSTIAEQVSEAGGQTKAFSANPKVSRQFRYDRGFDVFRGSWQTRPFNEDLFDWKEKVGDGRWLLEYPKALLSCLRSDMDSRQSITYGIESLLRGRFLPQRPDDGAREALEWVRSTPVVPGEFRFLNLMEAHAPYRVPVEYRKERGPRTPGIGILRTVREDHSNAQALKEAYEESVRYLSDVYEKIHRRLTHDFDYVITVADHGELFGEYGVWEHDHGLYPELTNVPLVISGRDVPDERRNEVVSLLDVHATILARYGLRNEGRGTDLLGSVESRQCLTEYAGLTPFKKDRLSEAGFKERIERYDRPLRGLAAPRGYYGYETVDGFKETGRYQGDGDPTERLRELTQDITQRRVERQSQISGQAREHLEDLGYM